jgi:8-oxo-dGTP pyrophosphatase MutT (NUDIX family)
MVDGIKGNIRNIIGIIAFDGERFLLLHRSLHWRGWEYPKGGIEDKETPEQALGRELLEETSIKKFELISKINDVKFFDKVRNVEGKMQNYLVRVSSNSVVKLNNDHVLDDKKVIEHDDFKWCFPEEAVKKLTHNDMKKTMREAIKFLGLSLKE